MWVFMIEERSQDDGGIAFTICVTFVSLTFPSPPSTSPFPLLASHPASLAFGWAWGEGGVLPFLLIHICNGEARHFFRSLYRAYALSIIRRSLLQTLPTLRKGLEFNGT